MMVDYDDTIGVAIRDGMREMNRQREEWLLDIFGSYEVAERIGKYYEIEEYPIETVEGEDGTIRFVTKCKLTYKPFEDYEVVE